MGKFLSILLLIIYAQSTSAQTIIKGWAPKYKGEELSLFCYDNYITKTERNLARFTVDEDGSFSTSIDISETENIFMRYAKAIFYFFAEPNNTYEIEFSEKILYDENEQLNPFLEPLFIAAKVNAEQDSYLNSEILAIDKASDSLIFKLASAGDNINRDILQSLFNNFSKSLKKSDNSFVSVYSAYRKAMLEYVLKIKSAKDIENQCFINALVEYNNPAYFELFTELYGKVFLHTSQRLGGKEFKENVNSANVGAIQQTLMQKQGLTNIDFCDLIILHNAYNEYYDSNFSRSALVRILEYIENNSNNPRNKSIAQNIIEKITKLLKGHNPPSFELFDLQGELYNLKSFEGKYVYLCFMSINSYACIKDSYLINSLHKQFGDKVAFVYVCIDQAEDINFFRQEENFNWIFLTYQNQPEILKEYDVRSFPTYYLLDTQGKLLRSPAPAPDEGLEHIFKQLK